MNDPRRGRAASFERGEMRESFTRGHPACMVWGIPPMPTTAALKEYDARVDAKKRLTIRGAGHRYFRVVHRDDGTIILKPRASIDAPRISAARVSRRTLRGMDAAVENLRAGKRSKPANLKKYAHFAK